LILEQGNQLQPIEIKSGETLTPSWLDNLKKWSSLAGDTRTTPETTGEGSAQAYKYAPAHTPTKP